MPAEKNGRLKVSKNMPRKTMNDVSDFFTHMKFKKKLFGGVSELEVIKKLEELQRLYEQVYEHQEIYYEGLLDDKDEKIRELMNEKNYK